MLPFLKKYSKQKLKSKKPLCIPTFETEILKEKVISRKFEIFLKIFSSQFKSIPKRINKIKKERKILKKIGKK
jgi:hypothetical protein